MKLFDYAALSAAVLLPGLSLFSALSIQSDSLEILIESENREWIYPIDSTVMQEFDGPVGHTTVSIDGGIVSVTKSDCSEKICVQSGSIENAGQWIACMPNRIFVTIRGKKEGVLDGEAY
jgi:hypothetical protein